MSTDPAEVDDEQAAEVPVEAPVATAESDADVPDEAPAAFASEPEPLEVGPEAPEPDVPEPELELREPEPDLPETPPDLLAADVADRLQSIERSVGELQSLEERHLGIIEKLHADNTELRQGELTQAMKPLLLGIGQLHDDVSQMIAHAQDDLQKKLVFVRELTLDLLERHGVTPLDPEPRSPFDPKQHTAVSGVPVEDPELHGTVAVVERIGFVRDGQHLVRPAQVSVHRHTPRKTADTQDSPTTQRIED